MFREDAGQRRTSHNEGNEIFIEAADMEDESVAIDNSVEDDRLNCIRWEESDEVEPNYSLPEQVEVNSSPLEAPFNK